MNAPSLAVHEKSPPTTAGGLNFAAHVQTWPIETIGDLFDISAGKSVTPHSRSAVPRFPFLRTSNVFWGRIDTNDVDVMHFTSEELSSKSLRAGDLLVCEGGDIGRAAIWNDELPQCAFQNHLHRLRPKRSGVVPRFFMYYLQAGFTQLAIYEGAGNRTTIPNLSRSRLASLVVPVPPAAEQERIAAVLAKMQSAIEVQDRLVAATAELKQAAARNMFARNEHGSRDSEIGPIPNGWIVKSITEICEIWSGGTPKKSVPEYWEGELPWVSGKDLKAPSLRDAQDHITPAAAQAGSRLAPKDSVLILVRGMGLAKDLPVAVIERAMAFNQDVKALVSRGYLSGRFIREAIHAGKDRLLSQMVPSAHGTMTLNLDDIARFCIACPSDGTTAAKVADALATIDRKLAHHQRKRAVLNDLFQTLLHKLMTGEIRVADLDIDTSEVAASAA